MTDSRGTAARYAFETSEPEDPYAVVELEIPEEKLGPDEEAFYSPTPPTEEEEVEPPASWRESLRRYGSAMAYDVPPRAITVLGPVREFATADPVFEKPGRAATKYRVPFTTKLLRSIFLPPRKLY